MKNFLSFQKKKNVFLIQNCNLPPPPGPQIRQLTLSLYFKCINYINCKAYGFISKNSLAANRRVPKGLEGNKKVAFSRLGTIYTVKNWKNFGWIQACSLRPLSVSIKGEMERITDKQGRGHLRSQSVWASLPLLHPCHILFKTPYVLVVINS